MENGDEGYFYYDCRDTSEYYSYPMIITNVNELGDDCSKLDGIYIKENRGIGLYGAMTECYGGGAEWSSYGYLPMRPIVELSSSIRLSITSGGEKTFVEKLIEYEFRDEIEWLNDNKFEARNMYYEKDNDGKWYWNSTNNGAKKFLGYEEIYNLYWEYTGKDKFNFYNMYYYKENGNWYWNRFNDPEEEKIIAIKGLCEILNIPNEVIDWMKSYWKITDNIN